MAVEALLDAAAVVPSVSRDDTTVTSSEEEASVVKQEAEVEDAGWAKRKRTRLRRRPDPRRRSCRGSRRRRSTCAYASSRWRAAAATCRPGAGHGPRVLRLRQGVRVLPGARRPQGQPPQQATFSGGGRRSAEAVAAGDGDGDGDGAGVVGRRRCHHVIRRRQQQGDGGARVPRVREDVPDGAGAGRAQALPLRRHHRQRRRSPSARRTSATKHGGGRVAIGFDLNLPALPDIAERYVAPEDGSGGAQPDRLQEAKAHDPGLIS
ncbi:hypothetical protein EJB05_00733, partial [Eragrostis curvula]